MLNAKKIMLMKKTLSCSVLILSAIVALTTHSLAFAEIYKHVDANGRITYSNVKTKGATALNLDPEVNNVRNDRARAVASENKRTPTPSEFPKVDKDTQNARDGKRKEILQSELAAEKAALEEAKRAYAEGESNPEVYRTKNANGSVRTFRNIPKFEEKMKGLQAEVDSHQRNIELLEKEIKAL